MSRNSNIFKESINLNSKEVKLFEIGNKIVVLLSIVTAIFYLVNTVAFICGCIDKGIISDKVRRFFCTLKNNIKYSLNRFNR